MKTILAVSLMILLGSSIAARADDSVWAQKIHRLEYIHFNPVNHTVEWGISGGAINDAGEFVPGDSRISSYTINLTSGMMTHNGEDGVLSPRAIVNVLREFGGLSQLMQGYTENWEGVSPSSASAAEDKDAESPDSRPASREDVASAFGLSLISQLPSQLSHGFTPRSAAGHFKPEGKRARRALQHSVGLSTESAAH
jgi:hypothetical protein